MSEHVEGTVRLKRWKTFFADGRSSVEYGPLVAGEVAVAVILGFEPLKIDDTAEMLNVEQAILDMADDIMRNRRRRVKKMVKP